MAAIRTSTISNHDLSAIIGINNAIYQEEKNMSPETIIREILSYCGDLSKSPDDLTDLYGCLFYIDIYGHKRKYNRDTQAFENIRGFSLRRREIFCKRCNQCFRSDSTKIAWNHLKSKRHRNRNGGFDIDTKWLSDEAILSICACKNGSMRDDYYIHSKNRIKYVEC